VIPALAGLLLCQLAGETIVRVAALPLPGPVLGMVILFALLLGRGGVPAPLGAVADALLRHLGLLFVPAGVGVVLHVDLLAAAWAPLALAIVVGTLAAIGVTGLIAARLLRSARDPDAG
jgi:putative effector of murein hydrolase LrgA (UPF0299 family)